MKGDDVLYNYIRPDRNTRLYLTVACLAMIPLFIYTEMSMGNTFDNYIDAFIGL